MTKQLPQGKTKVQRLVETLSLVVIVGSVGLGWGFAVGRYEVFPFVVIRSVLDFIQGDPFEDTTLIEKLENDFGGAPKRFLYPRLGTQDSSAYMSVRAEDGVFSRSRSAPRYYSDGATGAYLIYGIFEFAAGRYGALLVDHNGIVLRHWVFQPPPGDNELNPVKGGFLPNGYVVSNAFYVLQVQDYCGNPVWSVEDGYFHHSVEPGNDDDLWVFNGFDFERRRAGDGALVESFSIFDVLAANQDLHIFESRLEMTDWKFSDLGNYHGSFPDHEIALSDPFHFNDVDALSEEYADRYPQFEAGDLLVSSRALNLIFVVRPRTKKVLWYAFGKTSRQHDPDFNDRGTLTIFDNDNHAAYSRIVEMDVATKNIKVLVDGATVQLSNEAHGNHEVLPDGSIVFVDYRGRVLHLDSTGHVIFEFQNTYDEAETLEVRNVFFLTDARVLELERTCN